jgi:hypothetical protein
MKDAIQHVEPAGSAPNKRWDPKNPSEHKDSRSANENESHQRRDAAASLPPRPGLPFPFDNHRAESIPLSLPPLTHFPLAIPALPPFPSIARAQQLQH